VRGVIALAALLAAIAGARAETGIASVYAGGLTANGEHASPSGLTAAHKSLPFNTLVRVTNDRTGRAIVVRINDRGPFVRGRIIDLMPAAARAIGFSGLAHVTLQILELGHARTFLHRHHRARRVARRHRRRVRLSSAERQ
jgi:rare lipoprotein A